VIVTASSLVVAGRDRHYRLAQSWPFELSDGDASATLRGGPASSRVRFRAESEAGRPL
jgi:hypothetical protein